MTIVTLWPPRNLAIAERDLFGRPTWKRTLATVEALKPRRVTWLGAKPPEGVARASLKDIASSRDRLLIVSSELPCLTARTLRRLLGKKRGGPRALFSSTGGDPVAVSVEARALKGVRSSSLGALSSRVGAEPVFGDDDELHIVDSAASWSEAHRILRMRKVEALLKRGVFMPDPASVWVDPDVSVAPGVTLAPWVRVEGDSRLGKNCSIGSFSHLVDASIGPDTVILDHCFIRESRVGRKASIGPFAHLRPAAVVGNRARVGNFVELKKSTLGDGAKVSHLAYVGDATLGAEANLGAGTITCNYDGKSKNRTIVGDGAFIGSDVQLVAPVKIGKGAFVAAGSCIVEDVPAHALALARSRQVIKKGWAKKRS